MTRLGLSLLCLALPVLAVTVGRRMGGTGRLPTAAPQTAWGPAARVVWATDLPHRSHASPVPGGAIPPLQAQLDALNRQAAALTLADAWRLPPTNPGNGCGSNTPVSDGPRVYATFGTGVVACYVLDSTRQWLRFREKPTRSGRSPPAPPGRQHRRAGHHRIARILPEHRRRAGRAPHRGGGGRRRVPRRAPRAGALPVPSHLRLAHAGRLRPGRAVHAHHRRGAAACGGAARIADGVIARQWRAQLEFLPPSSAPPRLNTAALSCYNKPG